MGPEAVVEPMVPPAQQTACLHALVLAQCDRTPHRVMIRDRGGALAHVERASRVRVQSLARHLSSLGAGVKALAGVFLPRSRNLSLALLGVLAASSACVPLDPTHRDAPIASLLRGNAAQMVVTIVHLAERVAGGSARGTLLETEEAAINAWSNAPLLNTVRSMMGNLLAAMILPLVLPVVRLVGGSLDKENMEAI
jgi:non-ribosomal peptide synthetase component F